MTITSDRIIDTTDLPRDVVQQAVGKVEREIARWVEDSQQRSKSPSLFFRNGYKGPENYYAQLQLARLAVDSYDVVGGAADVTEGLILQGAKWEGESEDDADVFNQISRDLNLDDFLRSAYRELFTASQFVVATWWGYKEYVVRGYNAPDPIGLDKVTDPATGTTAYEVPRDPKTNLPQKPKRRGQRRRKKYTLRVPTQLTLLDSMKVVPIGNRLWGRDRLAWQASQDEMEAWEGLEGGDLDALDLTMASLFVGKYTPSKSEAIELEDLGVDTKRLLEFRPDRVFRHTLTKPSYARWPSLRMRSIFRLLDLKQQLQNADRVNLVGAANYILLVKKGSDELPAEQVEVDNLKENFKVLAKVPVIISDHRLQIEIITPDQDYVLQQAKYDVLDQRILARLMGSLTSNGSGQRAADMTQQARFVGRLLESRRQMLKRTMEKHLAHAIAEANSGTFEDEPNLAFTPRQIQLDADQQTIQAILALRTQKELSRETTLEFFGFDQDVEAQRRINEEESGMDAIFGTAVPFDSPANAMGGAPQNAGGVPPAAQGAAGAQGGRPTGGGQPPQNSSARARAEKERVTEEEDVD